MSFSRIFGGLSIKSNIRLSLEGLTQQSINEVSHLERGFRSLRILSPCAGSGKSPFMHGYIREDALSGRRTSE
ncbi:MAG: hypothetical protein LBU32_28965 [Clostridiales bacterium]|jgi:hypothetical protein|nr:hypothetical protein [Clostridiales bacterium]